MRTCLKMCAFTSAMLAMMIGVANAQSWTPLTHQPGVSLGAIVQLRDGRILAHEEQDGNSRNWWILTPDSTGSYVNGTWTSGGQLPASYSPWFFSSQVLLDGQHVLVEGGEYNFGNAVWTNMGALGTVTPGGSVSWVTNNPPANFANIGDAQSVILADGRVMQANCCSQQSAFYNGPNSWLANGNILGRTNDEAGYTLLQSGKVMLVDAFNNVACNSNLSTEIFDPTTNTWSCGPHTTAQLWDNTGHELGPQVLMYNNKVLAVGAVPATSIYDPVANSWSAGPTPAGGLDAADGPGALETNGKVLLMLSPGEFQPGCQMVEYSPGSNTLANTVNPPVCPSDSSFVGHLMVLPTGQIMLTDLGPDVYVYTPAPGPGANANRPTIIGSGPIQHFTQSGANNIVMGFKLNGTTQNNAYGDDWQGDTNYPIVRITNLSTGQVYWGITHDESTHSIDPNAGLMTTKFDLPPSFPVGPQYKVELIANGLASNFLIYQ